MSQLSNRPSQHKRVGIWIRVSTEDQARGDSPEHHEHRARHYAEAKEWNVVEVYHLEGVSGKAVSAHPEAKRMLADIERGHITGLIFSKLARLARNTKELLEFAERFKAVEADLISLQESIDTSTPAGRLFYTMIAAMAQWEREEIAERVAASVPIRAKLGKPLGGQAPFGYRWVGGRLAVDPKEAPVRRLVHELFVEHRRKKTVARLLNEAGHRTRGDAPFSHATIDRLLRDPTSKGVHRANYTRSLGSGKSWELKPESDWILNEVEAIVSVELWNQCHAILESQFTLKKPPGRKPSHLFAGMVLCHCGDKMYVPSNTPKYVCRTCRNKIPTEDLEAIYRDQLVGFLLSQEEIERFVGEAGVAINQQRALLGSLQVERRKLELELDRLFALHRDGEIPTQGFGLRYRPVQERLEQLLVEIPRREADIDFLRVNMLSNEQVQGEARSLADRWPAFTFEERRQVVEAITEQIRIGENSVDIDLCYFPVPTELVATRPHIPRPSGTPFKGGHCVSHHY